MRAKRAEEKNQKNRINRERSEAPLYCAGTKSLVLLSANYKFHLYCSEILLLSCMSRQFHLLVLFCNSLGIYIECFLKMTLPLPEIQPEKWRRYHFESKNRYYMVILQQNLFHEWSIIKCYGDKDNKFGNMVIESCDSYESGINKIEQIKKARRSRKYALKKIKTIKLGLDFEKITGLTGNMI